MVTGGKIVFGLLEVLGPVITDDDRRWFLRFKSCWSRSPQLLLLSSSPSVYLQPPNTILTILDGPVCLKIKQSKDKKRAWL